MKGVLNNVQKKTVLDIPKNYKQQIVELHRSGQPVQKLSREYGVATVTIHNWIKRYSPVKVSDNEEITAKEYQAMKKRIAQLEMENEILKKATAYSQENTR